MRPLKQLGNKIKFEFGQDPKIEKNRDFKKYIPYGFKSVLLIYADFELSWAWRFSKELTESASELAERERKNIPVILKLCEQFNIPVTWATVGHLFLSSCSCNNGLAHANMLRPDNFENEFWNFSNGDWYRHDPCSDYQKDPEWYCPDLIKLIISSAQQHEIACHTFSHIDCREKYCSEELMSEEIKLCIDLAEQYNISLKSFVHPAHTIGNLKSLSKYNFNSYRTDYGNILGYPEKKYNNIWEMKSTWEFAYFHHWDYDYHVYRYCEIINRAVENNSVCIFWFHPSINKRFIEYIMPRIFKYADSLRNDLFISTVNNYLNVIEA